MRGPARSDRPVSTGFTQAEHGLSPESGSGCDRDYGPSGKTRRTSPGSGARPAEGPGEQLADGDLAARAGVERQVVHVHPDEAFGLGPGRAGLGEGQGVGHGIVHRAHGVLDGVLEDAGEGGAGPVAEAPVEVAFDGVGPQGQGKAGGRVPPGAEIDDGGEAGVVEGDLRLVDDEPGVDLPGLDGRDDLLEGHGHEPEGLLEHQAEDEEGGRPLAGDRDDRLGLAQPGARRGDRIGQCVRGNVAGGVEAEGVAGPGLEGLGEGDDARAVAVAH